VNYRANWNLASIPDEALHSEVGRRRAALRPLKTVPPDERERLDRQREAVAKYRAKLRTQEQSAS